MKVWRGARVSTFSTQLADEHVDGAVAVRGAAAPDALQQLVARQHPPAVERERIQKPNSVGVSSALSPST